MEKATHNGHCQACGRLQAVMPGRGLAKHGYTVTWGFFNGTCSGSDAAPLETSRELLDRTVAALRDYATACDNTKREHISRVPVSKLNLKTGKRGEERLTREEYLAGGRNERQWEDAVDREVYAISRRAIAARQSANDLLALAERVHGQPLRARAPSAPQSDSRGFRSYKDAVDFAREMTAAGYTTRIHNALFSKGAVTVYYRAASK